MGTAQQLTTRFHQLLYRPERIVAAARQTNEVRLSITVSNGFEERTDTNTLLRLVSANHAPVVVNDALLRSVEGTLSVQTEVLLANDTDPDGDPLTVASVGEFLSRPAPR